MNPNLPSTGVKTLLEPKASTKRRNQGAPDGWTKGLPLNNRRYTTASPLLLPPPSSLLAPPTFLFPPPSSSLPPPTSYLLPPPPTVYYLPFTIYYLPPPQTSNSSM